MSTKHEIYIGNQLVEPPDGVNQIYNGNVLLWERSKDDIFIEIISEDIEIEGNVFTKSGLLAPLEILTGEPAKFFDIYGNSFEKTFDTSGKFIHGDTAIYLDAFNPQKYIEQRPDSDIFDKKEFSPFPTDTREQWSTLGEEYVAISGQLANNSIYGSSGHGIYPLKFPIGFMEGESTYSVLSYIKDTQLVANAGFCVLSVCDESLICGEGLHIKNDGIYATITERNVSGVLIRQLMDDLLICQIDFHYANSDYVYVDLYRTEFHMTGGVFFYRTLNRTWPNKNVVMTPGKDTAFAPGTYVPIRSANSIVFLDGFFCIIESQFDDYIYYTKSVDGEAQLQELKDSRTGQRIRRIYNNYYVDDSGAIYCVGQVRYDDYERPLRSAIIKLTRR